MVVVAGPVLHHRVSWTSPSLGHGPVNVFLRHLDRAALAVDAVLCVNDLRMGRRRAAGGVWGDKKEKVLNFNRTTRTLAVNSPKIKRGNVRKGQTRATDIMCPPRVSEIFHIK